ncbi:MAG TPA: cadherin-like domain-containing protein, partial [Pyrinomonadaceae bacterium]|nr:cadherin-like domain-containing protein [Pyrinomonadaceae bacterium]
GTAPVNGTLKKLGVGLASGGTFTQDDINNNRITYDHNGSQTLSDSFTFTVSDGAGGTIGLTTFNITIGEVDNAPTITAGGTLNYTENDPATVIDNTIVVGDVDSANLVSASVQITGNYVNGQDVLSFTNTANINGSFNAGTGTLTLTGTDSVANYQAALRSVRYNNTSDNPSTSTRTVSWSVNDSTSSSNVATSIINITAVNDGPVNTVPGPQGTAQNTPLVFSSGTGNQISVADVDAGSNSIQVTLTAANGTLTLSGTSGLSFSFSDGNGTGAGDGTADATMTFRGTLADVNAALNGMTFTPTPAFSGAATLTISSNDLGNTGTGGPLSDTDTVSIQVALNVSVSDAQVTEPSSGSVNMVFVVSLNAPAPPGGVSVSFTTQDEPPAISHAVAGQDYTTTSGTVNFAQGEQIKTISVPILSDLQMSETNETFLVLLSSPVNATITDGMATGTILIMSQPAGTILISELRTSGPAGEGDDYVEIYNNSDTPHIVNDPSGGYGLFKMGADCNATPVLIGVIPNGTTIPARGHYLFTGSAYSLANYGGTGAAAGDQTLTQDIENDRNVAIFSTTSLVNLSTQTRLDGVGFGLNTGGVCDLFREGTTLTPLSGSTLEYTYFRDECGKKGNPAIFGLCPTGGFVKDSNVNSEDFIFVDTAGTNTPAGQRLGAPGPQNLASARVTLNIPALLLDATKGAPAIPNRVRDFTPVTNGSQGTLAVRRRFVNNTGANVTQLRFRIVDFSSLSNTIGIADLRAITSTTITVSGILDSATCAATGTPATPPCSVTVFGTTVEEPPTQAMGGALNTTMGTITLPKPLAPGASANLQFLLGVQQTGSFKFFFNIEALP